MKQKKLKNKNITFRHESFDCFNDIQNVRYNKYACNSAIYMYIVH